MSRPAIDNDRKTPRGASDSQTNFLHQLSSYLLHHRQTFRTSRERLFASPVQTFMTVMVVAIALSLPTALYTAVENIRQLSGTIEVSAKMTLFLKTDSKEAITQDLITRLKKRNDIEELTYVSQEQALEEFRQNSGFGDILDMLDENPLPSVILIQPAKISDNGAIAALVTQISKEPAVDDVVIDMGWLQRLHILLEVGRKLAYALGIALGCGVLLIMGNTIRLAIESRRDEIIVVKLIGGTNSYVRRPFLYTGLWFGTSGGIVAWLLVWASVLWLSESTQNLAMSYQSSFTLAGPGLGTLMFLFFSGGILGLIGAWLAVAQHARAIEPK